MDFKEIYSKYKNIAVIGMSKNTDKDAYKVPKYLIEHGYNVIPVNPTADIIDGRKVYHAIADIPDKIDIVDVFRPSDEALDIVKQAIERHKTIGDIGLIWLQEEIINEEAKKLAEDNGIAFIQDRCIKKTHENLIINYKL